MRARVEEVGVVDQVEADLAALGSRRRRCVRSNLRRQLAASGSASMARPGSVERRLPGSPAVEQHLEERRARQVALGLQLLEEPLERARPGARRRRAPSRAPGRAARGTSGSPDEVDAQRQRVEEDADQPLQLRRGRGRRPASRRSRPPGRSSGRAAAAKPASRTMNGVAPCAAAEAAQAGRQLRRQEQELARPPRKVWTAGRGRSVGRSSDGQRRAPSRSRQPGELLAPAPRRASRARCQRA